VWTLYIALENVEIDEDVFYDIILETDKFLNTKYFVGIYEQLINTE